MTATLRMRWQARSPRERQAWLVALVVALAALYLAAVMSAMSARASLHREVDGLRADVLHMQGQARELEQLRALPPPVIAGVGTDLRTQLQAGLDGSAMSRGLAQLDAMDADRAIVAFADVSFADWLRWLEALGAQQVRLESCRVEALPASGRVSVTATLARDAQP